MTNFQRVFMFYSYSMGAYLWHLLSNLLYFFVILGGVIAAFFVSSALSDDYRSFLVILMLLIGLGHFLRRLIFFKQQMKLSVNFSGFLVMLKNESFENPVVIDFPRNFREREKEIKNELREAGAGWIPRTVLTALTAADIAGRKTIENIPEIKKTALRLWMMKILGFLVLAIPFAGIALLFTGGMDTSIKLLIASIGFVFAWFLNTVIVCSSANLILQEKITLN